MIDRLARAPRWSAQYYEHVMALHHYIHQNRGQREREVIVQTAYYCAHGERPRSELEAVEGFDAQGAMDLIVRERAIPRRRVVQALLPYVDVKDEKLREIVHAHVLRDLRDTGTPETANESAGAMLYYIRMQRGNTPWTVVRLLVERAPAVAIHGLTGMMPAQQGEAKRRQLFWADHVVRDAIWKIRYQFVKPDDIKAAVAELDRLSRFEEWWVRLYVAEILRRHKEFREPAILERLRKDENRIVAQAADVRAYDAQREEDE